MPPADTLERRVDHLEEEVRVLRQQVNVIKPAKDWRKTVGAFADDPEFQDIVRAAATERQTDRSVSGESC